MDAISFRNQVIRDYEQFARSYTGPQVEDIRSYLDGEYGPGRCWPSPLIQVSPLFVVGQNVEQLAANPPLKPKELAELAEYRTQVWVMAAFDQLGTGDLH